MSHPLDRPIWTALTGLQRGFASGDARAVRYRPEINLLAAAADISSEALAALAALVPPGGRIATVEPKAMPVPPGLTLIKQAPLLQMIAESPAAPDTIEFVDLGGADAPQMLALATRTEPGPFVAQTHLLGGFVGLRVDGRLVAMAGQRMRAPGLTEVSAVCTHPDHRGHGHAGRLMRVVMARIVSRGETPFLHSYPDNAPAIALYRALGFRPRRELVVSFLERAPLI